MPKYNPGDPVWVRSLGQRLPAGEHAAEIIDHCAARYCNYEDCYTLEVYNYPCIIPVLEIPGHWHVGSMYIRPRRDDYQQKEPLGSMSSIDQTTEIIDLVLEEA